MVTLDVDSAADAEPIRGVDLDRYARLSGEMLRRGLTSQAAIESFVAAEGITSEGWQAVQAGWIERLGRSEALRLRYHDTATAHLPPADGPSADGPSIDGPLREGPPSMGG